MHQHLTLVGYLGGEPTLRFTAKGDPVTTFSLAVSGYNDDTTWFRISVWGKQAESCDKFLHKGSLVLVTGRLTHDDKGNPRTYQRKDGTWAASFEVNASNVRFLPGKGDTPMGDTPMGDADSQDVPF